MKMWERWAFGLLTLAVSASGLAYFWMKYLIVSDDPFAVVNHPWQGIMLAIHVVASPALVLLFGILLNSHILRKFGAEKIANRKSGLVSFATFFVMTASGYLLQVVTAAVLLQVLVAVHVASGVVFAAMYTLHLLTSLRMARAQSARRLQSEAA